MAISWYAESPARRLRQVCADLLVVAGLLVCVWLGTGVHDVTAGLSEPGQALESAGDALANRMDDAGEATGDAPLAGDELAAPFEGAGDAGRAIEDAGVQQQQAVSTLALGLGWTVGGIPALFLLGLWLPRRVRFARQAREATLLRAADAGLDVLALRALTHQPIADLAHAGPALIEGWRERDRCAIETLAALELRRLGLRGG